MSAVVHLICVQLVDPEADGFPYRIEQSKPHVPGLRHGLTVDLNTRLP
jgi:hypothetical protein